MSKSDDSYNYSPCKACGKKLNWINDFIVHVSEEHPIKENYAYHYEDSQHRRIKVFKSFYGTFCWNYARPDDEDVSEYRDEYDDLCDKTTEQTKEELMETIKSKGWKYVKSEEISSTDLYSRIKR